MNMVLLYPRVLWYEQVGAGEQGPHRCDHTRRAKELMKWQRSATTGATNEPLWRDGTGRQGGFGRRRPTALFSHYIQGEKEGFPI